MRQRQFTPVQFIQWHSTLPTDVSCVSFYCKSAGKGKCPLVYCTSSRLGQSKLTKTSSSCLFLKTNLNSEWCQRTHSVESTEFYIWPSGVGNLEILMIAESYQGLEDKLDDILTCHRGGNWELVLPFSQLTLQQSLCRWILLQAPQSRDPSKRGADHHTAVRCPAWICTRGGLQTLAHSPVKQGKPQPRVDERKQQHECPESKAPFTPAVLR